MFPDAAELASFLAVLRAAGVTRWRFADGSELDLGAPPLLGPAEERHPNDLPTVEAPSALDLAMRARGLPGV